MACTKGWLEAFVAAGVQLHALASAPARLWHGADGGERLASPALDAPEHRDEITRACEAALGRTLAGRGKGSNLIAPQSKTTSAVLWSLTNVDHLGAFRCKIIR